ncbi:transportin-3-like [Sycon ciliatum]|uniref:transportin-3-like n=1 Tax=Sycon ciliatum TaxID=27933 RepID=UPI0031F65846
MADRQQQGSLQDVLDTLHALYVEGRQEASALLEQFQQSVEAWQVADEILRGYSNNQVACYFAASTMKMKISASYHQLPADTRAALRDTLFNHVVSTDSTEARAQLCLAIAYLALQMVEWTNPVETLIDKLSVAGSRGAVVLLQTLKYLVEECYSERLRIGHNRREEMYKKLRAGCSRTLEIVEAAMQMHKSTGQLDDNVKILCFQCTSSWLRMCNVPVTTLTQCQIIFAPFEVLKDVDADAKLYEAACDCVCSTLYVCEHTAEYSQLAFMLVPKVIELVDVFFKCVSTNDVGKAEDLCRVFTEMAEAFLEHIATTPGEGFGDLLSVQILLKCLETGSIPMAKIMLNFWFRLSEEVFRRKEGIEFSDLDPGVKAKHVEAVLFPYRPIIQEIVQHLITLMQLESDHTGVPSTNSDMKEFRTDIFDMLRDLAFINGSINLLTFVFKSMVEGEQKAWTSVESHLWLIETMCVGIKPEDDSPVILELLKVVLSFPTEVNVALQSTALGVLAELSRWFYNHPQYLGDVLTFVCGRAHIAGLGLPCMTTLCDLAEACQHNLLPHFDTLLQVAAAVDTLNLDTPAVIQLLSALGYVIGKVPRAKAATAVQQLVDHEVTGLRKVAELRNFSSVVHYLDRIAAIFKNINCQDKEQPHPCQQVVINLWPLLSSLGTEFVAEGHVMEHWCRLIRFCLRLLESSGKPLLSPLLHVLVTMYDSQQHSSFLYLASVCVDLFATDAECVPFLTDMMSHFSNRVLTTHLVHYADLVNNPHTVDDYYRLCVRFMQNIPLSLIRLPCMNSIVSRALAGLVLHHREAAASISRFFTDLIRCASDSAYANQSQGNAVELKQNLDVLLEQNGLALVNQVISASCGSVPYHLLGLHADVLYALLCVVPMGLTQWLQQALSAVQRSTTTGLEIVTEGQLSEYYRSLTTVTGQRAMRLVMQEFYNLFR